MTNATKLIAIEVAVVVAGLALAVAGHGLAAATWFAGYVIGYRKCLRTKSTQEGDKG